jgi:hypothetical protein
MHALAPTAAIPVAILPPSPINTRLKSNMHSGHFLPDLPLRSLALGSISGESRSSSAKEPFPCWLPSRSRADESAHPGISPRTDLLGRCAGGRASYGRCPKSAGPWRMRHAGDRTDGASSPWRSAIGYGRPAPDMPSGREVFRGAPILLGQGSHDVRNSPPPPFTGERAHCPKAPKTGTGLMAGIPITCGTPSIWNHPSPSWPARTEPPSLPSSLISCRSTPLRSGPRMDHRELFSFPIHPLQGPSHPARHVRHHAIHPPGAPKPPVRLTVPASRDGGNGPPLLYPLDSRPSAPVAIPSARPSSMSTAGT